MKKFFLFLILCISLNVQGQTLSEIAQEMNKSCPMKQGFFEFSACRFSQNTFIFDLSLDGGSQFNIKYFMDKPAKGKEWFKVWLMFIHKASPYICNRAILKNVSIKLNIKDISHNLSHIVTLTPNDIKNAITKYGSLSDNELSLTSQVVSSNIQTPQVLDEITTMTGATLTSQALQFEYIIDDSELDMSKMQEYLSDHRADMLKQYTASYAYESIVAALVETNRSLKLLYRGKYSKQNASLSFSPRELSY